MNKVQRKRLLNVARALRESDNPRAFTMRYYCWARHLLAAEDRQWDCGTPACALGHYAARSDLQRTFRLNVPSGMVSLRNGEHAPGYGHRMRSHFGLSYDELDRLFGTDGCGDAKTPVQAARYIERFVARTEES